MRLQPPRAGLALALLAGPACFAAVAQPHQPARPLTAQESASQVLNRLAFGPRPGQVAQVEKFGWRAWAEQQLRPDTIPDADLDRLLADRCPTLRMDLDELRALDRDEKRRGRIKRELTQAVILRAVHSRRQFQEVMAEFWRNHFNVDVNKVPALATHYEETVLRRHAFGKFEDLLLATAKHPAMLVYLDNHVSRAGGLNENYARELMELHTLGVDNGYTQTDVIDLARVLTGWTCGPGRSGDRAYGFVFNPAAHDARPATVVGLALDGAGGLADGERAVRHLARHPRTAAFVCAKLCRYLVGDDPPRELVERTADVFRDTGGDLRAVYRAIVFSPEFTHSRNFRSKFKTPVEFVVSALRVIDTEIDATDQLARELRLMGQPIYECVEPTGYSDQAEAWLDPGVMVFRWNFAIELVQDKVSGVKAGADFIKPLLRVGTSGLPQKVKQLILPGVVDTATGRTVAQTADPRAMVALVLGAPSFQQQ